MACFGRFLGTERLDNIEKIPKHGWKYTTVGKMEDLQSNLLRVLLTTQAPTQQAVLTWDCGAIAREIFDHGEEVRLPASHHEPK